MADAIRCRVEVTFLNPLCNCFLVKYKGTLLVSFVGFISFLR